MNPKDNVQEYSNHFATSSKSVLSTSESCLTMTSAEDETIEKKKTPFIFCCSVNNSYSKYNLHPLHVLC